MNLDCPKAFDVLMEERVLINDQLDPVFMEIKPAGDPVSGGALLHRQDGDQYVARAKKVDYKDPQVHDSLKTVNFGTLRMKQRFPEGEFWALMLTGNVKGRRAV